MQQCMYDTIMKNMNEVQHDYLTMKSLDGLGGRTMLYRTIHEICPKSTSPLGVFIYIIIAIYKICHYVFVICAFIHYRLVDWDSYHSTAVLDTITYCMSRNFG